MNLTRRRLAVVAAAAAILPGVPARAQASDDAAVNAAVEALRQAMVDADKARLEALVSDQVSYGHSGGVIENKADFINVVASKKTVYKTIRLLEPSTAVVGNNAIVRHVFTADFETDGKPGSAKVGVLQVWQKQDGAWKLLARQAFRLPS
jgi:ketosteroid isomerase-like protein